MKFTKLGMLALVILVATPVYAAKEVDCLPGQELQTQRNETTMSEDLLQNRKQARDADMARLREQFMRATAQAPPARVPEQRDAR